MNGLHAINWIPLVAYLAGIAFKDDRKYPYFMATAMPTGLAGLLIATLYAATMSNVDSGINSCTTAFMVDFRRRLKHGQVRVPEETETGAEARCDLRLTRILTIVTGVMVTAIACLVGKSGSIIWIASTLVNGFCGPMFAIFLLGRRAKPLGAFVSLLVMWYYTFFAQTRINFQWTSALGLLLALGLGYGLSLLESPPQPDKLRWTLAESRKRWRTERQ